MSGTYNKCQKETTCQSFTHVPRNGGKNQPVLLEHILPVVVNAPTVCSNSLQACSWLDLATRETSWDTRAIRFDLPSEPTLEIPKSQFDHDEEEDRPLLAQVARFARAHSIRMPDSKQHQRVRKSPCERGRRTIRHGVLGIGRAQTEKKNTTITSSSSCQDTKFELDTTALGSVAPEAASPRRKKNT